MKYRQIRFQVNFSRVFRYRKDHEGTWKIGWKRLDRHLGHLYRSRIPVYPVRHFEEVL